YRQLRDHRHVDGGPVPAHQTEFTSEGESDAIDFPPQVVVGVLPHLPGVAHLVTRLSLPDESNLVLPRAPHVPVKAEVRDVGLRAREPPRYVRMLSIFEDGLQGWNHSSSLAAFAQNSRKFSTVPIRYLW